jgi:hypothetical protein
LASGVNNAVARTAGLLAVAALPLLSGVGESLTDPTTLAPAYRTAMLMCAGLMALGGLAALATIPSSYEAVRPSVSAPGGRATSPVRSHCAVGAPPLHPSSVR